jgi:hypothetical protein
MSSLTHSPESSTATLSEPATEDAPKNTILILPADIPESTTKSKSEPATKPAPKATLLTLPPEIKVMIFSLLEPSFSTCLGLASKRLYPIHRAIHGKVYLHIFNCFISDPYCYDHPLDYLTEWLGSGGLIFDVRKSKLVSIDSVRDEEAAPKEIVGRNLKRCALLTKSRQDFGFRSKCT